MNHRSAIASGVTASALWLFLVCLLADRFNVPSGDGILYSLPLAVAKQPFDLGIPFLNDFNGCGSTWGHHWPGSLWLKGAIFFAVPYSRTADVALLSLFQLLAAITAATLVWSATKKPWAAAATLVMILSDRLFLLACAGNRFESIAVAAVLLLFANSVTGLDQRNAGWRWLMRGLAFLCPTLHPYGLAMGALILGYDYLSTRARAVVSLKECVVRTSAYCFGCIALATWFLAQPDALRQFTANLSLQESFYQNWNSVLSGLGNYRLGCGPVLWGMGLVSSCLLAAGWSSANTTGLAPIPWAWRLLAPALFVTVILIHTLTRCENFHYLAFGSPFAVMLVSITVGRAANASPPLLRRLSVAALAAITAIHGILLPYRIYQFKRAGLPNLAAEIAAILDKIPANRTIYIPHLCWPAASADRKHEIRWFTFPIASPREVREGYERAAYADIKPGDVLIIDNSGARQPDKFGLYPTFPLLPPDPSKWTRIDDRKVMFSGSVAWGIDLSVYEFGKKD